MLREVSAGASARIRRDGAGADFRAATAAAHQFALMSRFIFARWERGRPPDPQG